MLVLSRKTNQKILIGDNITVTVLKVRGNTVRLGIEAPRDISVVRGELPRNNECKSAPSPVTLEFRSNGNGKSKDNVARPSLRVVDEGSQDIHKSKGSSTAKTIPVNRLRQLAIQVATEGLQNH